MDNYQDHPLSGATDLDSAMTKLWAFYKKYFIGMYMISVVLSLLSGLLSASLDLGKLQTITTSDEMITMIKEMIVPYSLIMAVSLVFGVLLHAWVLERPLGEGNTIAKVLKISAGALIPYLLVMIVLVMAAAFITAVGLVLLILPGIFALFYSFTVAIFALPVTLIETRNPGTVMARSFSLAHNHLWPNMGWVVVVTLIVVVISMVAGALVMLPFTGSLIRSLTSPEEAATILEMAKNPLYIILNSLISSLVTPVFAILAFILYFRNREIVSPAVIEPGEGNTLKVEDLYPGMPDNE
jgi:hypothetical protein